MKKFLLAAFLGLTIVFATVQAQAAEPEQDTWVLNWDGTDYYVVAGTLEYNEDYGIDVPLEFSPEMTYALRTLGINRLLLEANAL